MWKKTWWSRHRDDNIIRGMRFACRITKATNTHSENVTITFLRQQLLRKCTSVFSDTSSPLLLTQYPAASLWHLFCLRRPDLQILTRTLSPGIILSVVLFSPSWPKQVHCLVFQPVSFLHNCPVHHSRIWRHLLKTRLNKPQTKIWKCHIVWNLVAHTGRAKQAEGFRESGAEEEFGPMEWRRLHNEEIYALYSSPDIIRVMKLRQIRYTGHVARMGRVDAYGRRRRRGEDNIKIHLQVVECGDMHYIHLAQDRDRWRAVVSTVINLRVSYMQWIFLSSWGPVSFSNYGPWSQVTASNCYQTIGLIFTFLYNFMTASLLGRERRTWAIRLCEAKCCVVL